MRFLKLTIICFSVLLIISCVQHTYEITPQMEAQTLRMVEEYLNNHNLPIESIVKFHSNVRPSPSIAYLYTGGDRCIEFIFFCYEDNCNEMNWYPYKEQGEECPVQLN